MKRPGRCSERWPSSQWAPWTRDHKNLSWFRARRHRHRLLFLRFAGVFGFISLLALGGLLAMAFVFMRSFNRGGPGAPVLWLVGCGLSLGLPLLVLGLAMRVTRGVTAPLADVMAAADAVAEGDLSVRVPTYGSGEFGRLARSFNRMTEELERAARQRRNLTADVAHELRTPVHIIQGKLEGVLDGVYEPTVEHIVATLEETRLLARLVDDLRILSLAEAGQLPLVREPIDLVELLTDVQTSFSGQAEAAGVDLRVKVNSDLSTTRIMADVGRLDQVLGNLTANALRHTPPGGSISLKAERIPAGARITVRDTGEGIPPEDLPYAFDRFWRGDRSRSSAGGAGSGLGLAIARQLVQAHGGQIGVESELGQGTMFFIDLPAGEPEPSSET